jgi:hypothetical protein
MVNKSLSETRGASLLLPAQPQYCNIRTSGKAEFEKWVAVLEKVGDGAKNCG